MPTLLFSSSLPHQKFVELLLLQHFDVMGSCSCSLICYQTTSFASPQHKTRWTMSVDNVGLKICLLETLDFMVTLTFIVFLDVIWNGPKMSLTSNHRFYRALGRLHGPWCKRSLSVMWASHGMEVCLVSERAVQFNTWEAEI